MNLSTQTKIFIALIALIISYSLGLYTSMTDIKVSDDERWSDINNLKQRDSFCKYQGFDSSSVVESLGTIQQGELIGDYAPSPFHDVVCIKHVEERQAFNYNYYKKWILGMELSINK